MRILLPAITLLLTTCHLCPAEIIFNAQQQPTFISDLVIAGVQYNVSLQYGGSFDSIYGDFTTPSPSPTFWGDSMGATSAVAAMGDALNLAGGYPTANTMIVVPIESGTWFLGDKVDGAFVGFNLGDSQYSFSDASSGVTLDPHVDSDTVWPTFTLVPEPSSGLLVLSAVGCLCLRRRRKI